MSPGAPLDRCLRTAALMDSLESRPEQPTRHHGRNRGHRGEALDLTESRASGSATDWEAAQEPKEQQGHLLFLQSLGEPLSLCSLSWRCSSPLPCSASENLRITGILPGGGETWLEPSYLGALGGVGERCSYLLCLHQRWVQPPPQGWGGGSHHSDSQGEGLREETGAAERDLPESSAVPGGLWDSHPALHNSVQPSQFLSALLVSHVDVC